MKSENLILVCVMIKKNDTVLECLSRALLNFRILQDVYSLYQLFIAYLLKVTMHIYDHLWTKLFSDTSNSNSVKHILECCGVGSQEIFMPSSAFLFLGFSVSAARLGLPDAGLISYGEMVDQGQKITEAVSIPVIGDGDNGYGNAMNVKRTVKGYIKAGLSGIILEDQVGHLL